MVADAIVDVGAAVPALKRECPIGAGAAIAIETAEPAGEFFSCSIL